MCPLDQEQVTVNRFTTIYPHTWVDELLGFNDVLNNFQSHDDDDGRTSPDGLGIMYNQGHASVGHLNGLHLHDQVSMNVLSDQIYHQARPCIRCSHLPACCFSSLQRELDCGWLSDLLPNPESFDIFARKHFIVVYNPFGEKEINLWLIL